MGNAQRKEKDVAAKASKPDKTKKDGRRTLQEEFQSGDDIQSSFETIQKDEITGLDADGELSTAGVPEAIGDSNQGKQNVMFHDLVQQLDSFSIPIKSVPPSNSAIDGQELEKLEGSTFPASSSGELSVPSPARQGESAAHSLEAQKVTTREPEEALKQAPPAQVEHGDQSGVVPMSQEAVEEGIDPVSDKAIPEPREKQDPPTYIDISEGATNNEAVHEMTHKPEGEEGMITEDVQPRQVIENEPAESLKDEVDQECKKAVLINEHAAILDPAVDNRKVELAGVSVPPEEAPLSSDIIIEDVSVASDGPSEAVNGKLKDSNFELSEGPETFKEEKLHESEAESRTKDSQNSSSPEVVDSDAFEDPKTAADSSAVVKDQEEKSLMVEDEQHAPVVAEEKSSNERAPSENGELDAKSSLDTAELLEDHPSDSAASADGDSKGLDTSKDPVEEAEVPTIQATETADETEADKNSTVATENEEPGQDTKEDTTALETAERKEQDTEEPLADSFVPEDASKQTNDDSIASIAEETNHQTTGSVTEENVENLSQPVAANERPSDESTEDANVEEGTWKDVFSPIEDSSKNTEETTDLHDDSIAANGRLFPTEDKEDVIDVVEINDPVKDTIKDQNEPTVLEEDLQGTLDDSVVADDSMASTVEVTSDHVGSITDKAAAPVGAGEPNTEDSIASTGSDAEATKEDTTEAVEINETEDPVENPSKDHNEPAVVEEDSQETLDGSVVADDSVVEETNDQIGSITDKIPAPIGAGDEDSILASTGSDAEAIKEDTNAVEINESEVQVEDHSKDQNEPAVVEEDSQETLDGSMVEERSDQIGSITDKVAAPGDEDSILASTGGSDAEDTKEDTNAVKINESEVDPSKDQNEPAVVKEDSQETLDGSVVADHSMVEETSDQIGSITDKVGAPIGARDEDSILASTGGSDAEATKEDTNAVKINESEVQVEDPSKDQNEPAVVEEDSQEALDGSVVADEETSDQIGSITDKVAAPIGAGILASTGSDAEATKEDTTNAAEKNETEVPVEDPSKDKNEPAVVEEVRQETLDGSVVADDSMASAVEGTSDLIGSITDTAAGSEAEATKEDAIARDEDPMLASIGSTETTEEDASAEKESVCIANEEAPDKTSDVVDTDTQEPVDSSGVEEASREIYAGNDAASEPIHSTVEEMNDQSNGVPKDEANVADSTTGEPTELLATKELATSTKGENTSGNIRDDAAPKEDLEETKENATQINDQINKDLLTGEKTSEERQNDEVVANVDVPELIEMQESVGGIDGEVEKASKEPAETSEVKNVDSTTAEPNTSEDHEVKNKDEARNASTIDENMQVALEGVAATTEATGQKPSGADEIDTGAISSAAGEYSNDTVEPTTTQETFEETQAEAGNEGPTVDSFSAEDGPIEVKGEDVPTAEDVALVPKEMNNEEPPAIEDQATTKDLTNVEVENATEKSEEPGAVEDLKEAAAANEEVTIQEPIEVKDEEVPTAAKEANEMPNEDQPPIEVENTTEKSKEPGTVEDPKETKCT